MSTLILLTQQENYIQLPNLIISIIILLIFNPYFKLLFFPYINMGKNGGVLTFPFKII